VSITRPLPCTVSLGDRQLNANFVEYVQHNPSGALGDKLYVLEPDGDGAAEFYLDVQRSGASVTVVLGSEAFELSNLDPSSTADHWTFRALSDRRTAS
jgi:hypothetical protein